MKTIATSAAAVLSIVFEYGKVWQLSELPPNSIALDGAAQGPQVDPENRKFSFDHHQSCVRLVTLATCQQVYTALKLGLIVDDKTVVYANDIDADTVVAVWLLQRAHDPEVFVSGSVKELVEAIGLVDAHGPLFPEHPLHRALGPHWSDETPQDAAMLAKYVAVLDRWYDDLEGPVARPAEPAKGYALRATGGWEPVESSDGFRDLYERGYMAAALYSEAAEGSLSWMVGKRSDLVPLPLGPAHINASREGGYRDTILGRLAAAEEARCGVTSKQNWGGGTSIGGSPRLGEGNKVGSKLPLDVVLDILQDFTIG